MHPQPKVKDVDESQGEDEVFHQDSGSDDDVEVLSSYCAKDFRSKRSLPSSRSSPSKSSTAGSTSLIKSTRRTSKAVIEAEDEDEEIRPPGQLLSPRIPPADDSVDCSQPCQNSTVEAMVFHNPLIQTGCPASSNLSISAQEFQPRVQSEILAAGETKHPPGFLAFNNRHEASSCLSHQYQAPVSFPPQPLYQPVYQANSQPYQFVQVNSCFNHLCLMYNVYWTVYTNSCPGLGD